MTSDHDELSELIGAYLLGGLDPDDRRRLDAHLVTCDECRRLVDHLSPVTGVLAARLDRDAEEVGPSVVVASTEGLIGAIRAERRGSRRRRAVGMVAVAACVAAIGFGVGWFAGTPSSEPPDVVASFAPTTGPAATSGEADLFLRFWGSQLEVALTSLPTEPQLLHLEVVDATGARERTATWRATASGRCTLSGATSFGPDDIVTLVVVTDGGDLVSTAAVKEG